MARIPLLTNPLAPYIIMCPRVFSKEDCIAKKGGNVKKLIALLFVACLFLPFSESSKAEEPCVTKYECFDSRGAKRWTAVTTVKAMPALGERVYQMTEKGEGIYSGYTGKVKWEALLEYEETDILKPLRSEKTVYDEKGKVLSKETHAFDYANKEMGMKYENFASGKKIDKKFSFKGNILDNLSLDPYIQTMLENSKKRAKAELVTSDPDFYNVDIRVKSEETIEKDGKKISAYKICVDPNLGLLNVVKSFGPKAYFWHDTKAPHDWLMYRGPEDKTDSPTVEIRVVN